jgi:predicted RNA-binding protein YlqC (UPF0109 family)
MSDSSSGTRDELARSMTELVTILARALVDHPSQVEVEAVAEGEATLLRLRVAQADLGKVIGKQGRTARSIRTLLGAASMKAQHRFGLDIQQHGVDVREGFPVGAGHTGNSLEDSLED